MGRMGSTVLGGAVDIRWYSAPFTAAAAISGYDLRSLLLAQISPISHVDAYVAMAEKSKNASPAIQPACAIARVGVGVGVGLRAGAELCVEDMCVREARREVVRGLLE